MAYLNENQILNILSGIEERAENQENEIKALQSDIANLRRGIAENVKNPLYRLKNRLIVRYMNHFLTAGLSLNDSIVLTSARTHEDVKRIETVFNFERNQKRIAEKAAKMIMIRRLDALHYPKKEIARITGYSEKYIFEIMRKNFVKTR